MTRKERQVISAFTKGLSVYEAGVKYGTPYFVTEDILRKALKAQDKKKGKT